MRFRLPDGGGGGVAFAVGLDVGEVCHQPFGGFEVFVGFIGTHPQGVVFFVGGFVGFGVRFDEQFAAAGVDGEVFEFGLGA